MKMRMLTAGLVAGAMMTMALGADGKVETVPLKLDLPKVAYEGTPRGVEPDIVMEKPTTQPRAEIAVPKGCENLSLKKKVTASDDPIMGDLALITDGNKDNIEVGTYAEFGMGLTWVQVDLEKSSELYAVVVWHFHKDRRVFRCVVVQVSDDPEFKKGVTTLFNNDQKNDSELGVGKDKGYVESREGKLVEGKGVKGRYVLVYSKGNTVDDNNQFTEVEVWGLAGK
jgi:hypothetical protein